VKLTDEELDECIERWLALPEFTAMEIEAFGELDADDDFIVRWRRDDSGEWIREEGTLADFKRRDEPDWPLSRSTQRSPE
jgi:hypothetical protein